MLNTTTKKGFTGSDVVVVSPKNSGVKRARSLAEYLDAPIAIIDYAQDDSEREEGYIIGEVEGKTAILVDDILNTGKHLLKQLKSLNVVALKTSMQLLVTGFLQEVLPKSSTLLQSKKSW